MGGWYVFYQFGMVAGKRSTGRQLKGETAFFDAPDAVARLVSLLLKGERGFVEKWFKVHAYRSSYIWSSYDMYRLYGVYYDTDCYYCVYILCTWYILNLVVIFFREISGKIPLD